MRCQIQVNDGPTEQPEPRKRRVLQRRRIKQKKKKEKKRITYSVNTAGPLLLRTTSDNGIGFQAGSAERTDVCNCSCQHNDCVELSKEGGGGGGEGGLDLGSLPQLLLNCLWLNGGKHHRSETDWRGKVLVGAKNEKNLRQRACLALSVATLYGII